MQFSWEKAQDTTPTPYYLQSDDTMETLEALNARRALKSHPLVQKAITSFFRIFAKDSHMRVPKLEYITIMARICRMLIPEFSIGEALATVEVGIQISKFNFLNSWFCRPIGHLTLLEKQVYHLSSSTMLFLN